MRVIVVGAGLSGLSLAAMLRRLNIQCLVLEQNPHLHSVYHSPIVLWSNALSCYRAFGIDQMLTTAAAAPESEFGVRDPSGKWLLRVPNETVRLEPMDERDLIPSSCAPTATSHSLVSRTIADHRKMDLATVPLRATFTSKFVKNKLREHVLDVRFNARVVDLLPGDDLDPTRGGVHVVMEDGSSEWADVVVGADGMRSAIRKLVYPSEHIALSNKTLNMTQVDGYVTTTEPLPGFGSTPCEIWGKRKFVSYTPLFHEGTPRIAFSATLLENPADLTIDLESLSLAEQRTLYRGVLSRQFAEFGPQVASMFAQATVAVPTDVLEVPIMPRWHNKRAVLIGEAAHGAFPSFLAQDASLCVEDAAMLATALAGVSDEREDLFRYGFRCFERSRRERVERYIRQSRRARNFAGSRFDGARNAALGCVPFFLAGSTSRWLSDWSYRSKHLAVDPEGVAGY